MASCTGRRCRCRRRDRRIELLLADDVLLHQRLVALQVRLSLDVVGLGLGHTRVRGLPAALAPAAPARARR